MRVLLINPTMPHFVNCKTNYSTPPNGLLFLAAILEAEHHTVEIYDRIISERTLASYIEFAPDLVGISVVTSPGISDAIFISQECKRLFPNVPVVWGGVHPSVLPRQTLAEDFIDFIVIGEGEYTLRDLVTIIENGEKEFGNIDGLAFKENGTVKINRPRPFIKDLDELPDPAWHLIDVTKYTDFTLNTSRGCPFRCTFCYNTTFHPGHWGQFSAERIVSQIQYIKDYFKLKYIKIWEDNFTFNIKRLREFCDLLQQYKVKIKWDCETRVGLKEEDIKLMAKCGCTSVGIGVESGSPRLLKFLCKDISTEDVEKTVTTFIKHAILPRLYIIEGVPTETIYDFTLTRQLLKRLDYPPYQFMKYVPYPETPLYKFCVSSGLIQIPKTLADWAIFTHEAATTMNFSFVPQHLIDQAMSNFVNTYSSRPLRYILKHNFLLFISSLKNPRYLKKAIHSLVYSARARKSYLEDSELILQATEMCKRLVIKDQSNELDAISMAV